jgi:hypothetical protein
MPFQAGAQFVYVGYKSFPVRVASSAFFIELSKFLFSQTESLE